MSVFGYLIYRTFKYETGNCLLGKEFPFTKSILSFCKDSNDMAIFLSHHFLNPATTGENM